MNLQKSPYRPRHNFSKIRSLVPIPNMVDIQKRSYDEFLQLNLLHSERESRGLKAIFESMFPVHNGKTSDGSDATHEVEFLDYIVGHWACKCERYLGQEFLRTHCGHCGHNIISKHPKDPRVDCPKCGTRNKNAATICDVCQEPVSMKQKMSMDECMERGATMSAPLKIRVRLNQFERDDKGNRRFKQSQDSEIYFGDLPIMTDRGTFIINGTERVIVSQLHRSPGAFFSIASDKSLYKAQIIPHRGSWLEFEIDTKGLLYARINRKRRFQGVTLLRALGLFYNDLGSNESMLRQFYKPATFFLRKGKLSAALGEHLHGRSLGVTLRHPETKEVLVARDQKITQQLLTMIRQAGLHEVPVSRECLEGAALMQDVVDMITGEVIMEANDPFDLNFLEKEPTVEVTGGPMEGDIDLWWLEDLPNLYSDEVKPIGNEPSHVTLNARSRKGAVQTFEVFFPDTSPVGRTFSESITKDPTEDSEEAAKELFKILRPGEPATLDSSRQWLYDLFSDCQKYDLSKVGRHKINAKLGLDTELEFRTLDAEDVIQIIHYLLRLKKYDTAPQGTAEISPVRADDIDHLGNRRVRSVGELLENAFSMALALVQRSIKEKLGVTDDPNSPVSAHDLISSKPVIAAMKALFGSSYLSQFMDQTNPLSELSHKRRLSALGPGGLSSESAGFEVRDVHSSHYGRICPIETPEGPNIGLISNLSCYARINEFGFIESPYLKVENGQIIHFAKITSVGDSELRHMEVLRLTDLEAVNKALEKAGKRPAKYEMHAYYLSAWEEDEQVIAQANVHLDKDGLILDAYVTARVAGETKSVPRARVTLMDVSPNQVVSAAASLIPFLEHNDSCRALMGANMQRQALPLIRTEAPIVGTGMEYAIAKDSGACVVCRRSGFVETVDANRILVRVEDDPDTEGIESGVDFYTLVRFARSNQNTCINQTPLVKKGEYVTSGQVIADGPSTDLGELALGRNLLVAYMPWRGFNFDDAILISERAVKEDLYTTIHIEEFEVHVRDTKLGPEEITRDIPMVREEALESIDDSGIIRIGATVKHGDILVGKVTPKGETLLSPEEKYLHAIFGEKASDVKDASLTVPPGIEGTVVDVKVFTRKGQEKDLRTQQIERDQIAKWEKDLSDEERIIRAEAKKKIVALLKGKELSEPLMDDKGQKELLPKGKKLTQNMLEAVSYHRFCQVSVAAGKSRIETEVLDILDKTESQLKVLRAILNTRMERLLKGDELMPGVLKTVKCYVAVKRKLQVGDKMAGRHGNKGVVSRILPVEDMPYLPDGRPVDIVLNPLGVPSRMNIGQVLECHLGWAGKSLGVHFSSPVFDGARECDIKGYLNQAWEANGRLGPDSTGKTMLFDGMTGEAFEQPVTVGCIYMLKLHHLVDNKIHARSIGPYSLITQQPLGGKAQFGGQRIGEMEVWALEAYGAAHVLQELLTYKSDDMQGRTQIYQAIIKGETIKDPGLPESFNVVKKELNALGIDVEMLTREELDPGLVYEEPELFSIEG